MDLSSATARSSFFFFFKQKTAYEIGLGIPAEPLFRSEMQQQDNHEYPFLYQRQTCHQVQPNQATYQKRQKCQPATYLQDRKSGSAEVPACNVPSRSEERRVGKECRSRWSPYH